MPVARAWDRWTAFLLSLCLPGAGQVWAGSGWCVLWFGALLALPAVPAVAQPVVFLLLGVSSARHAKRLLSGGARGTDDVTLTLDAGRVDLRTRVKLPYARAYVWAFVSDLERFGIVDPFHDRIHRNGRDLVIEHCICGMRFDRVGRILHWHDGVGYAFSDLSTRGPRVGFPHVFFIKVLDDGTLEIRVRGKWTERWMPRRLVSRWLLYVAREHARLVRAAFGAVA